MVPEKRLPADLLAIAEQLVAAAPSVGFFPLVAFLERLTAGMPRVGDVGPASEEGIRFRHDPRMTFSAGDVSSVRLQEQPVRPGDPFSAIHPVFEVTTAFLGLTGSVTPLPFYMAEEIAQEDPERAPRREFLDLFHHRLLSLFSRIRARYDVASEHASGGTDRWSQRMLSMCGITGEERLSPKLSAWRLLRLAPLLSLRARTARGLEVFLEDVLEAELEGARITLRQFVGSWAEIDVPQRMQLGRVNSQLGRDTVIGSRIFFRGGKYQIRIGPLTERAYRRFLPDGDMLPVVREAVEVFVRDPLDYALDLVLGSDVAAGFKLSRTSPALLGRNTWLASRKGSEKHLKVAGIQRP